ncbi:MAG: glycosyltransferase family 4 protein [Actinobacteria bacterium]|nr:glycosyltransferase family 4 protein [Actinomycetota bacterium]
MNLGYACEWWRPRKPTWSYTAGSLLEALLRAPISVCPLDAQRSLPVALGLQTAYRAVPHASWKYSRLNRALIDRAVTRRARRRSVDAVLEVADVVTPTSVPTFSFQDMNFSVALAYRDAVGADRVSTLPVSEAALSRLADEQMMRYQRMAGLFAASEFYARWLTERQGVPHERVHVVGCGLNHASVDTGRGPGPPGASPRVLFVGVEFVRKGGDVALEAVARIRAGGTDVRLTVVGPSQWPLDAAPPPWVDYRGAIPGNELLEAYATHDVLVMPTRFEAYGIGVLEAQAAALPVVVPRAFALPELVDDGITGVLVETLDADAYAEAIMRVLSDEGIYASTAKAAPSIRERHSWDRVAQRILCTVGSSVS